MALVLWYNNRGEDEVVVYAGKSLYDGVKLIILLKDNINFEINPEWISRIKLVTPELKKTLLDADFCLSLSVGDMSENKLLDKLITTGLKWPKNS